MSRYSLKSLYKLFQDPSNISKAVRLFGQDILSLARNPSDIPKVVRSGCVNIDKWWYALRYGDAGEDFLEHDWDTLIILDACHPELLCRATPYLDDDIQTKTSPGTASPGFMEATYHGRTLHDTVYVTANPYAARIPDGTFHAVENLLDSEWDAEAGTVYPEAVVHRALEAHETYPNKRLIVHFMQPHFPFLGKTGTEIPGGFGCDMENIDSDEPHPWFDKLWGDGPDRDLLLRAYYENHEYVVPYVEELHDELDGKSVITSDHANLVGERGFPIPIRLYGHPGGLYHPNLTTVPWVVLDSDGPRRTVRSDPPVARDELDDETVNRRLESLGYA
ncbi:hypothetical protein [Halosimplex sp. J119]